MSETFKPLPPNLPDLELMRVEFDRSKAAQMEALSKSIANLAAALAECSKLPADGYTNPAREIVSKISMVADSLTGLSLTQFCPMQNPGPIELDQLLS